MFLPSSLRERFRSGEQLARTPSARRIAARRFPAPVRQCKLDDIALARAGLAPTAVTVRADRTARRCSPAERFVRLLSSVAAVPCDDRPTGDTGELSRRREPSSHSASTDPPRTAGLADEVATGSPRGVSLAPDASRANRDAAARVTASCGVSRDDGVWITECAWCKRVRSVGGDWLVISSTARAGMRVERTHGICPRCSEACIARASGPPP